MVVVALAVPMATMKSSFLRVVEKVVLGVNVELGLVASLRTVNVLSVASY